MGQKKFFANAVKVAFSFAITMMMAITFAACSKDNGGNNDDEPDNGEAYVVKSADGTTLTFYYDTQKASRSGTVWGIENKHEGTDFPIWTGTEENKNKTITQVALDPSFKKFSPTTTAKWFCNLTVLTQITGIENLNTSKVTDMSGMFNNFNALTQLDATKFDTKNVTDMSDMFCYCEALTSLDISSNFNTAKVTNMNGMFYYCKAIISLDVSNFNTAKVTDMDGMFVCCCKLKSLDVSNFNTANVTNMKSLFSMCSEVESLDVSNFNTAKVTNTNGMFWGCKKLKQLDLSNFNVSKVEDMEDMFQNCKALRTIYCNDKWTCSQSDNMFDDCTNLKGAVPYDENKVDATMANPTTGYFTNKP